MPEGSFVLQWYPCKGGLAAEFLEDGMARIGYFEDGLHWWVDHQPYARTPVIHGRAASFAEARAAAERQCAAWPLLVEGAWLD